MAKVETFHNGCLRKICNIFWPSKISNKDLYEKAGRHSHGNKEAHDQMAWPRTKNATGIHTT